jgi:hypothetical protein
MFVRYEILTSSLEETLILLLMLPSLGTEVSSPVCLTGAGSDVCAITADPAVDAAGAAAVGTVFTAVSSAAAIVDDTTTVGDDAGSSTAGGGGTADDADEFTTGLYRLLMAAAPDNTALFDADDSVELLVFSVGAIPVEEESAVRAVPAAVVPAARVLAIDAGAAGAAGAAFLLVLEVFFEVVGGPETFLFSFDCSAGYEKYTYIYLDKI